jgi:hypothetical protein
MVIVQSNIILLVQFGLPLIIAYIKVIEAIIIANTEIITPTFKLFVLSFVSTPPYTLIIT